MNDRELEQLIDKLFNELFGLESEKVMEQKPFPNEHAARLKSPNMEKIRVRRTHGSGKGQVQGVDVPTTIDIIWYIVKKDGKEVPIPQSLRFPIKKWTADQAKRWLVKNKIKYLSYEPAKKKSRPTIILNDGREVEYKSCPTEIKVDEGEGIVEGYASVFGNKDSYGDIVDKGAFKKTIKEFFHRIKIRWQHRESMGIPLILKEDAEGLYTKAKITLTQTNRDRLMLMRDGVVTEMSIGFDTLQSKPDDDDEFVRHLTEVRLWEASYVDWGANDMAGVTSIKSDEEIEAILFKLNDILLNDTKEGRVLSGKNRTLVTNAIEVLQALLVASEPDGKSTQSESEPQGNEPINVESLVDDVLEPLKSIQLGFQKDELFKNLKDFGKRIKGK